MTDVTVNPLSDPSFGARVSGVTLDNLENPAVRSQLNDAFEQEGLLIF